MFSLISSSPPRVSAASLALSSGPPAPSKSRAFVGLVGTLSAFCIAILHLARIDEEGDVDAGIGVLYVVR